MASANDLPVVGDAARGTSRNIVPAALAFPRVNKTDLDDMDHIINDSQMSGKGDGGIYVAVDGNNRTLVTASGTTKTSTWITVGAATSVVYTTPS